MAKKASAGATARDTAGKVLKDTLQTSTKSIKDKILESREGTNQNPMAPEPFEQAAAMVQAEKIYYIDSNKQIKNTIKRVYKNYLGVFDEPVDPYTGRRKIFTPLTHDTVDLVAKGVKFSSKSVKILPLTDQSRAKAKLVNMILPYMFQLIRFDDILERIKQRVPWLGTQDVIVDWLELSVSS